MKALINIATAATFVVAGVASTSLAQASTASEAIERSTDTSLVCYYFPGIGLRCF